MLGFVVILLSIVACFPIGMLLSRLWTGYDMYQRAVKAFGKDKVRVILKPLSLYDRFCESNTADGWNSQKLFTNEIEKNPDIKIIIVVMASMTYLFICDPDIIKKLSFEQTKNVEKRKFMIFGLEIEKGLVLSEGEVWKKSRAIMSSLFHFEMLKERETIMKDVVEREIKNLENQKVDLFKFGCTIGGDIVIESLLGKQFNEIRFGTLTPLEEIQDIIQEMIRQTINPLFLLRGFFCGSVTFNSKYLLPKQQKLKERLLNVKKVGFEFLEKQMERQKKGEKIAPFVKAYIDLNDPSYFDEVIQQLIIFLIAGQDTTGSLIEECLYMLAKEPKYQDILLKALKEDPDIHNNKELNNFINETNRLIGPVRFSLVRKVVKPFEIDGMQFQLNDTLRMAFSMCMLNVKYFDKPYEFNPDRFNSPPDHPYVFTPFSGGPRNCIGQHMSMMEVRIALVEILNMYRLELSGEKFQMIIRGFLNTPKEHHLVRFIPRNVEAAK